MVGFILYGLLCVKGKKKLRPAGLEPAACRLGSGRSVLLSYGRSKNHLTAELGLGKDELRLRAHRSPQLSP